MSSHSSSNGLLVRVERSQAVASLILNRPEARNALSVELCDAIVAALEEIDNDDAARVVIVRGTGKAFCAGADFASVSGPHASDFLVAFEHMLESVARHRLPTIARIHGAALGGGLQLATVCDFRIAASDAAIGIPSASLGIVVNLENVQRLVALAGVATAKEVLMGAARFTGDEAHAAGLVTRSVIEPDLDGAVQDLASRLSQLAPLSVQGSKRAIQLVVDHMTDARAAHPTRAGEIDRLVANAYASDDLVEGMRAAAEKRAPRFTGR